MEHIDVINKIIEAEHRALAVVGEAQAQRERLPDIVAEAVERLRGEYSARANSEIDTFRMAEDARADAAIDKINAEHAIKMNELEALFLSRRDAWAERVFKEATAF